MTKVAAIASVALPAFRTLAREEKIERSVSVALVGYGQRGEELLYALTHVPGVRIAAVADVWPWRRELAQNRMRSLRLQLRVYETLDNLLVAEGDAVDAVIVATPDWQHANHVTACLRAGKHVYCEGELADTAGKARDLVRLARETKLLVQGGHQRRSNPRYIHAFERVCRDGQALGRVTHAYAQWHRGIAPLRTVPQRFALPSQDLDRHGYANMTQFLNWEWFRRYGLGGVASLAGQKLDLMRWFWQVEPVSVTAVGGSDYYGHETPDSLMALFTFKLPSGELRRGYVQVLNSTSRGGEYELFNGKESSLLGSELLDSGVIVSVNPTIEPPRYVREELKDVMRRGYLQAFVDVPVKEYYARGYSPIFLAMTDILDKPSVQPHLENFVAAIRGEATLSDPIGQACANLIAVEGALRSMRERCPVDFTPQDFTV